MLVKSAVARLSAVARVATANATTANAAAAHFHLAPVRTPLSITSIQLIALQARLL